MSHTISDEIGETFPHTLDMKEFTEQVPPHACQPPAVAAARGRQARRAFGVDVSRLVFAIGVFAPAVFLAILLLADVMEKGPGLR